MLVVRGVAGNDSSTLLHLVCALTCGLILRVSSPIARRSVQRFSHHYKPQLSSHILIHPVLSGLGVCFTSLTKFQICCLVQSTFQVSARFSLDISNIDQDPSQILKRGSCSTHNLPISLLQFFGETITTRPSQTRAWSRRGLDSSASAVLEPFADDSVVLKKEPFFQLKV